MNTLQKAQNSGNISHAFDGFVMPSLIVVCIIQMDIVGPEKPVSTHKTSRRDKLTDIIFISYSINDNPKISNIKKKSYVYLTVHNCDS